MKFGFLIKIVFLSIFFSFSLYSKESKDVKSFYDKALKEFDKSNYDKAIEYINEGLEIAPNDLNLLYEKGFAYYLKRDFKSSILIFNDLIKKGMNEENIYVLLGNSLDYEDHLDSARVIYNEGISKFPSSGALYYQLGNSFVGRGPMADAVAQWETGVQNDPAYPNNYFQLSKYYSRVSDKIWSILYGEIFLNISDNAEKSKELSFLLYQTYKDALFYEKDSAKEVRFTSIKIIYNDSIKKDLPFAVTFQKYMKESFDKLNIKSSSNFSISDLIKIRKNFINSWYKNSVDKKFSNIIFDKHKKMIDDDVFEAYNYWLFKEGNDSEFNEWIKTKHNKEKFKKFNNWFVDNPENMSMGHFFTRFMYDYMINNLEFKPQ